VKNAGEKEKNSSPLPSGGGSLVYDRMRYRNGPTGLGDGPPIEGLGLKLIVGCVGGGGRDGVCLGGGREGGG
jgi:hypothetical protein